MGELEGPLLSTHDYTLSMIIYGTMLVIINFACLNHLPTLSFEGFGHGLTCQTLFWKNSICKALHKFLRSVSTAWKNHIFCSWWCKDLLFEYSESFGYRLNLKNEK